jgi:FkbM family methyltransferase
VNKIIGFLKLGGENISDKIYIYRAKLLYILYRTLKILFHLHSISMGQSLTNNVIAKNSYGKFYCRKKDEDLHIISEQYENRTLSLFKSLAKKSKIIIDVGAHIGKYTIIASKLTKGKVIAIDPSKDNFHILKKNILLNKCKNVLAFNLAVTNKNKKVKLYKPGTSVYYTIRKIKNSSWELVNGVSLDYLLKRLKIKKVDLIKIDVEGAELDVIEGFKRYLISHRVDRLIIEILEDNFSKLSFKFNSLGYSIKKIEDNNYIVEYEGFVNGTVKK